jgi:hypothetical protein
MRFGPPFSAWRLPVPGDLHLAQIARLPMKLPGAAGPFCPM